MTLALFIAVSIDSCPKSSYCIWMSN